MSHDMDEIPSLLDRKHCFDLFPINHISMGLRGQLFFLLLCFHYSWSNNAVFVVQWNSTGTSEISNHLDVILNDVIRFNCTNHVSNIVRTDSEQAYNQCASTGVSIGQCQADVPVITALLLFGEYQTGSRYYFYSTYGTECANGVKFSVDILEARPSSSTVDPTTTASNTMNPTGTGSAGTVTGSAGTVTGSAGTVTGSTTSRTSVTILPTSTVSSTVSTVSIQSNINTTASIRSTSSIQSNTPTSRSTVISESNMNATAIVRSTSIIGTTSSTPTVGGSDESESSFLDKLPLGGYFFLVIIGVLSVLLFLIVLPVSVICFRKRRGTSALVQPRNEEEKGTYKKTDSAVGEKNGVGKSEEKTKEKNELKKDGKIDGKTAKDRVEIKKAVNGNAVVSYKRNEEGKLSPRTNIRPPPSPPTTSSNGSVPKTASSNSHSVPKTASNSVPKTASSNSVLKNSHSVPKTASSNSHSVPKTASSSTNVPKTASITTPVRNNATTDPKSLPASMSNKQVPSGPTRTNNQVDPQSLPATRRPAPTPNSVPAGHKRPAPSPPTQK